MVGGIIVFTNNAFAFITAYVSATSLTVAQSQTVSSQGFTIYYGGLQADYLGNASVNNLYMPASKLHLNHFNLQLEKKSLQVQSTSHRKLLVFFPSQLVEQEQEQQQSVHSTTSTGYTASGATEQLRPTLCLSTSPTITTRY